MNINNKIKSPNRKIFSTHMNYLMLSMIILTALYSYLGLSLALFLLFGFIKMYQLSQKICLFCCLFDYAHNKNIEITAL